MTKHGDNIVIQSKPGIWYERWKYVLDIALDMRSTFYWSSIVFQSCREQLHQRRW